MHVSIVVLHGQSSIFTGLIACSVSTCKNGALILQVITPALKRGLATQD